MTDPIIDMMYRTGKSLYALFRDAYGTEAESKYDWYRRTGIIEDEMLDYCVDELAHLNAGDPRQVELAA